MSVSLGLLILRLIVGLLLAGHGAQKLFGWFGGSGFARTTGFLQSQGFKPAWLWTLLGSLGEFGGGLLLALGLLSPLGAIAIFASMLIRKNPPQTTGFQPQVDRRVSRRL